MSLTAEQGQALTAALAELERNYDAATRGIVFLPAGGAESVRASVRIARMSIDVLRGDLLDAVRGLRPWPLDDGTQINTAGALGAWLQLAASVKAQLEGIQGVRTEWSGLAWLQKVGGSVGSDLRVLLVIVALVAAAYLAFKVAR